MDSSVLPPVAAHHTEERCLWASGNRSGSGARWCAGPSSPTVWHGPEGHVVDTSGARRSPSHIGCDAYEQAAHEEQKQAACHVRNLVKAGILDDGYRMTAKDRECASLLSQPVMLQRARDLSSRKNIPGSKPRRSALVRYPDQAERAIADTRSPRLTIPTSLPPCTTGAWLIFRVRNSLATSSIVAS